MWENLWMGRLIVSNETILATTQEFFFKKVAAVQSITDIVLLGFWLILPPWLFISFYTSIYFFVNNFFQWLYFGQYDIGMFSSEYLNSNICFLVDKLAIY